LSSAVREWVTAYIGLGANLGDACAAVLDAMQAIAVIDGVVCTCRSSLYASAPVDSCGPDYVNAVVEVKTRLTAMQLLVQLQAIESKAGRERPYRNAPRTLDLDVLLYGQSTIQAAVLTVPHPRMWERAFVLLPLSEIAPQRVGTEALERVRAQVLHRVSDF
jgi:2-amino-4-hydroxy-6-hydroxymethyldihydropteridine diphosphokinase